MAERKDVARLVKVGVSALSGDWKRTAGDAVNQAMDRWADSTPRIEQTLSTELKRWATDRDLGSAAVENAIEFMTDTLDTHGASMAQVALLGWDPERAADEVLAAASARLQQRSREERTVARKIAVTFYKTLVSDPAKSDSRTEAAVRLLLARQVSQEEAAEAAKRDQDLQLREHLERYLTTLIADVSIDPWPRAHGEPVLSAANLERTLSVVAQGVGDSGRVPADELADSSTCLVLLGGPGSGKTWLARRIARRVAALALSKLKDGATVDEVEVPLLLTCEQFRTADGSPRDAAINPAVDARSDLGAGAAKALKDHLQHRDSKVRLILDSLDEATTGQREVDQALIGHWRAVITSRPAAWQNQWSEPVNETQDPTARRVTTALLEPLSYPDDVRAFAQNWASTIPGAEPATWAEHLMSRLDANAAAKSLSTTPVFLTFLCLVAPEDAFPSTRHELLDHVLYRLLDATWRGRLGMPGPEQMVPTAQKWAWDAAHNDPVNGLSEWPDTFLAESPGLPQQQTARLDALAPPVGPPRPGTPRITERRFVHRVLREHLVARQVAAMTAKDALRHLTIHWWFDPTWAEIIPTILATHPDHNTLLKKMWSLVQVQDQQWQVVPTRNSIALLLQLCVESRPSEWNAANRNRLDAVRVQHATQFVELVSLTRHWTDSNPGVVEALSAELATAPLLAADIAKALMEVDPRETTRRTVINTLTKHLSNASPGVVPGLARALMEMDPSETTRRTIINALTKRLHKTGPRGGPVIATVLMEMDPSETTHSTIINALTKHLPHGNPWIGPVIARALMEMHPSGTTSRTVIYALTKYLSNARPGDAPVIATTLVRVATTDTNRRNVIDALTKGLHNGSSEVVPVIARALMEVDPSETTRRTVINALTKYLPHGNPRVGLVSATALMEMDPSETTRRTIVNILTKRLHRVSPGDAPLIATALMEMDPSETTRRTIINALTKHLSNASPRAAPVIATALMEMDPSETMRRTIINALTKHLSNASPRAAPVIATALMEMDPSDSTRRTVIDALIDRLHTADARFTANIARTLLRMEPCGTTRRTVIDALIDRLHTADARFTANIARTLLRMEPCGTTRRTVIDALTKHLSNASPRVASDIAKVLRRLSSPDEWYAICQG